jgi:DNA-binding MarR family transcriptional regulator
MLPQVGSVSPATPYASHPTLHVQVRRAILLVFRPDARIASANALASVKETMAIVKNLDDVGMPPLIDHVGWRLWQAAQAWKERFDAAMVEQGYPVFREARSRVLAVLDFGGTPQADLAHRLGMSKQAVQQLVDQLVNDGFVERVVAPVDGRSRVVRYTTSGAQLMTKANAVKRRIERGYRKTLCADAYAALDATLEKLTS